MMYEILSPCGSMEAFLAAISAGADAVYLAGKMFGARSFANNFTDEELVYVINYAHLYGVKVYVTCNILIFEHEVEKFLNFIEFLHKNNVDAVIMQDIGMIDLVHKTFPNLEIHGSTQMHIHNLEGAFMAKELGLKRIVLARETPLTLVKEIKEKTGLEVEVFVHGALCVSYSGMCLFAASIGPRSGNRGTCSGCCRLSYQVLNSKKEVLNTEKYPLSMKDLMTLQELDKLIEAGVDSFKIEGRMKSPSYVYTTTRLYKETRDNYLKNKKIVINKKDIYNLKNIFARPYTKGYLLNANNNDVIFPKSPNHQGVKVGEVVKTSKNFVKIKCSDTISIHDGLRIVNDDFEYGLVLNEFRKNNKQVYKAYKNDCITFRVNKLIPINSRVIRTYASEIEDNISNEIKNKKRRVPISLKIIIQKEKPIKLIITDFKNTITIHGDIPELAQKREIKKEEIREKLEKIKDTIYEYKNLEILLDDNLFVPIKSINFLKKEAIEKLNQKRLALFQKEFKKEVYQIELKDFTPLKSYAILSDHLNFADKKYTYFYSEKEKTKILKLPKVMPSYANIDSNQEYLVGELGSLYCLKNVVSDYSFNVVNSYSVALLHSLGVKRVTLSLELTDSMIETLITNYQKRYQKRPNLELIIKNRWELMVLKFSLDNYYKSQVKYLVDRFKNYYHVVTKNNLTYIYDYKETIRGSDEKYFKMGINSLREENYEEI